MAAKYFSYWVLPVFSALVWIGTLLGLLLHWLVDTSREHYPSMSDGTKVAYVSDAGAYELKPLFITGCTVTVVFLDLSFFADRWLRHRGRLVPNSSRGEKVLSWLTILFAVLGAAGLILLSVFDTNNYPKIHDGFLLLFMGGYVLSAIFICWEYQRLGAKNRNHRVLRVGFWIKLAFIMIEVALSVVFIGTMFTGNYDVSAVFEWVIAFVFSFYVFSFVIDLYPAIYTKQGAQFPQRGLNADLEEGRDMEEEGGSHEQVLVDHRFAGPLVAPRNNSQRTLADDEDPAPRIGHGMQSRHLRNGSGVNKTEPPLTNF
ncbi:hypothetical protein MKZ38_010565 [Zalerion maritima]|uniref:CWH43-like N-terminal domain-containing protein n=1 Tax=Zalerion maritima TaxID=339359 RepID=A0AAD5RSB1_9PEZI|nr:hypothetical protein MKZ38_010565 [Zalerion maritima]